MKPKSLRRVTRWFKRADGSKVKTVRCKDGRAFCWCDSFVYRRDCRHVQQAGTWK